uniref:Uncharacterized protein n=1 Tax=Anguilla anguilla TaxID=7936 RepID=A0A0E9VSZ5_ANGAN
MAHNSHKRVHQACSPNNRFQNFI